MRSATPNRRPLVLTATTPKADIFYYGNERREKEVVLFNVLGAQVDGAEMDWGRAYQRTENRKSSLQRARLLRAVKRRSKGALDSQLE